MRSEAPKRAAMSATVAPASASAPKASTWSAGCMATRTTFSASDSSPSAAPFSMTRQGTGWSPGTFPSLARSLSAARRRAPAMTAKRSPQSSAGPTSRTTRFSSTSRAAMEALSSAKAPLPASVLRTLAGEGSSRWSGMDRMTGSVIGFSGDGPHGGGEWTGDARPCAIARRWKRPRALSRAPGTLGRMPPGSASPGRAGGAGWTGG